MVTKKIKMVMFDLIVKNQSEECRMVKDICVAGNSKKLAYDEKNHKLYLKDGEQGFPVNIRIVTKTFGCIDEKFLEFAEEICTKKESEE